MKMQQSEKIRKANRIDNPLELIKGHDQLKSGEVKVKFESKRSSQLDDVTKEWCFSLFERNMKKIYEQSKSGWKRDHKWKEIFDSAAYFIIAIDTQTKKPVGYTNFRFDMDFENEVIYCYELQVENEMRRFGIGKFLMEILEAIAEKLELEKVILTCSKYNEIGQKFFKQKLGYERDETDLNDQDPNVDYDILSKCFWSDVEDEEEEEE